MPSALPTADATVRSRPLSKPESNVVDELKTPGFSFKNSDRAVRNLCEDVARRLFNQAREEWFESGMDSPFADGVESLLNDHGLVAANAIGDLILSPQSTTHVAAEAARILGRMTDSQTHGLRREYLEQALRSPSHHIRDAAGLGLASMNDPLSISAIRAALEAEPSPMVKHGLQMVLDQLTESGKGA